MFYASDKCLRYLEEYRETGNLAFLLACFSADVWETMEFAADANNLMSKADEREFTNNLIPSLHKTSLYKSKMLRFSKAIW